MLINKSNVRKFALNYAKRSGRNQFTRVSQDVIDHAEFKVREAIRNVVDTIPSKGKTIQLYTRTRKTKG